MKAVFISTTYNHHQSELSVALSEYFDFNFIETTPLTEERKNLGWGEREYPYFVRKSYTSEDDYKECIRLINDADVVIKGGGPEALVRQRIKDNKLTFRYSERIYKNNKMLWQLPLRFIKNHYENCFSKNIYLLCASAYAAKDYALTGNFIGRAYRWGYFPKVFSYDDIDALISNKNKKEILWCGRFLPLKHPDDVIAVADILRNKGYAFHINMIGTGVMENELKSLVEKLKLNKYISFLNAMSPDKVREYMEKSGIFLFTSDRNEGWGAVLNEAMNSGCAVVASDMIGSVPFLIKDGKNGLVYKSENKNDLVSKVEFLLNNKDLQNALGKKAYETMVNEWNANEAAKRFFNVVNGIKNGNKKMYETGLCSLI